MTSRRPSPTAPSTRTPVSRSRVLQRRSLRSSARARRPSAKCTENSCPPSLARRAGAEAVLALVDEGAWAARWKQEPARIADRRVAWRQLAQDAQVPIVFVDLSAPDLAAAEQALDAAIAGRPLVRAA